MGDARRVAGSFRDPAGSVYAGESGLYRTVTAQGISDFQNAQKTGLLERLVADGLLVSYEMVDSSVLVEAVPDADLVLEVERIPFVSYPYEWSFSQLRHAALLTLRIQSVALEHGMCLKDASAYNVQFVGCRPVFIDLLSFEPYVEGAPWVAYRQFCQHFLAPLALMSHVDVRLGALLRTNLDGIPLSLASRLLPSSTWIRGSLLTHIHLHSRAQRRYEGKGTDGRSVSVGKRSLVALIESLLSGVKRLSWSSTDTEWSGYYGATNYSARAMQTKEDTVAGFVASVQPRRVWDLGANTGRFARSCCDGGAYTVAFDIDPGAVERAYLHGCGESREDMLPLVLDLMNGSPDLGWRLRERPSFLRRDLPDLVLGLALVHHLSIANNIPLDEVADLFAEIAPWAVVEFVPKDDSQIRHMLASREDIFPGYHREGFETSFCRHFEIVEAVPLEESGRILYLLRKRGSDLA